MHFLDLRIWSACQLDLEGSEKARFEYADGIDLSETAGGVRLDGLGNEGAAKESQALDLHGADDVCDGGRVD